MKLTKRKGFNFFRSYYDVYNELENDKDKVAFIEALLDRQFLGIKPTNLKGMAKFAYISQTNSIDAQVKGYEDKTGETLNNEEKNTPYQPPTVGGNKPPCQQVEVEGEVKEKVEVQENIIVAEKSKRFIPPTIIEVKEYCLERKNNVDSQRFIDHYTSNGWMVGKNKMKDWKSAVRTWEKNNFNQNQNGTKPNSSDATVEALRRFVED